MAQALFPDWDPQHRSCMSLHHSGPSKVAGQDSKLSGKTSHKSSHKAAASTVPRHKHDCRSSHETKCNSSHKVAASAVPRHEHDCRSSRKTNSKCSHRVAASAAPKHVHAWWCLLPSHGSSSCSLLALVPCWLSFLVGRHVSLDMVQAFRNSQGQDLGKLQAEAAAGHRGGAPACCGEAAAGGGAAEAGEG